MSGPGLRQQHVLRSRKVTITGNTIQFRSIVVGGATARHSLQFGIIGQGMVHYQATGWFRPSVQIDRSKHCFESIYQQTLFTTSPGAFLTFTKMKEISQMQMARGVLKVTGANEVVLKEGKLTFVEVYEALKKKFTHQPAKHRVAQKLQAFVVQRPE